MLRPQVQIAMPLRQTRRSATLVSCRRPSTASTDVLQEKGRERRRGRKLTDGLQARRQSFRQAVFRQSCRLEPNSALLNMLSTRRRMKKQELHCRIRFCCLRQLLFGLQGLRLGTGSDENVLHGQLRFHPFRLPNWLTFEFFLQVRPPSSSPHNTDSWASEQWCCLQLRNR